MNTKKLSTKNSLIFIVTQFVLIITVLILLALIQSEIMSSVRAYVRAEGLYAKGHLLAVQNLQHFIQNQSGHEIALFKENISIPKGDRIAREALQRPVPDRELAYQGFLQGQNNPDDIPGMIRLFVYFQDLHFFKEAIQIWTAADVLIADLDSVGHELIQSVLDKDHGKTQKLILSLEDLNQRLVDHEINFSNALTQGSHWVREKLIIFLLVTLLILGVISTIFTKRLIQNVNKTESELQAHKDNLETLVNERTRKLENVIEGTNAGTWSWNLLTQILTVNDKWGDMIGYAVSDIEPIDFYFWERHLHPDDSARVKQELDHYLKSFAVEGTYYDEEFRLKHQNGSWVWINARGKVTDTDNAGNALIMSGTHIDITERKLIEDEREKARIEAEVSNQEKSRFLANMSHELRTPMHAIHSFTRLALKRDLEPKVMHFLENIDVSTQRLTHLLNDLLDLSKLEAGKMKLELRKLDFSEVILATVKSLESLIREHHLKLDTTGLEKFKVTFDPSLMTQVITNLLSNAIKFSPEAGAVILKSEIRGLHFLFSIEDEGIGVPPDEAVSIFDSFIQSTKTMSNSGGTGLGLPITKEIIELHGGTIWVGSPPKNKESGSIFTFQIPLALKHA